jgi:penicillin G amidase
MNFIGSINKSPRKAIFVIRPNHRPMRIIFTVCLVITLLFIFFLNRSWNFGKPIPPLGKFLDPFHGFWKNAESKKRPPEIRSIPGLKDQVTVVYDSLYIPHIFAQNENDLFLAQGYVTARDRLWQMEFQAMAAAGRVSEVIGKAALDFDRRQRRLGMVYGSENALKAIEANPDSKAMVDHYTKGVNAYIQSLSYETLPLEYKLLDYSPEPWTNLKVAFLQLNMAKTLNMGESDLELTNALKSFDKETLDLLYPDNEHPGDPIVDNPGSWKFAPVKLQGVSPLPAEVSSIRPFEKSTKDVGSNNWAVSGSKTSSGSPILCNDPHLTLSLPSIWYIIHLQTPSMRTMGASLPGAPTVVSGFTDSIAWGVTNAQRDVVDWYAIKFKDKKRLEYLSDGKWKPARKVVETFLMKGSDPVHDTLTHTHLGPIVFDESFHRGNEKRDFAFRWLSHDPSSQLLTFLMLNHGRNYTDYMKALDHFEGPGQNFAFASVSGDIAMRVQGKYPVRNKDEGKFILDGTLTTTEWKFFIPNDQNITYKNPDRGFVSSANQFPVDDTYPYYIHGDEYEAYRNRRINQVLASLSKIEPKDMMKLQGDTYNLQAVESLPTFLSYLDSMKLSPEEVEAFHILKAWDYFATAESQAQAYYDAWWETLFGMIWDEVSGSPVALKYPTAYTTIKLIREQPDLSFFDMDSTPEKENAGDVIRKAFTKSVLEIAGWKKNHSGKFRWSDYRNSTINHLLRLPAFSYPIEQGGNHNIVNATSRTRGPSWRLVASMEHSGVNAWGVYPGGQSGNPGSPYYNNLLDHWEHNQYFKLDFSSSAEGLKGNTLTTITLYPAGR